jgi:2-polyprenyl-3-methyl-5-hydroxy-6-metoxy-1,4-benzoquinol methylase/glycosyltransferase involved in cell wall biosynthesis
MKLAYFSPLRPQRSGIADYSEELLHHLASGAELTLYVDGFKPTNRDLISRFETIDYRRYPERLDELRGFDAILYHMGNDHRYHTGMLDVITRYPGIIVLHDFGLQDFFLGLARERGKPDIYLDEVEFCHGTAVRAEAEATLKRSGVPSIVSRPIDFPLNKRIINSAEAIIVHSQWVRGRLLDNVAGVPVVHIPHLLKFAPRQPRTTSANGEVRIANFGLITPAKGIEVALRALSKLRADHNFRYTLVGEPNSYYDVRRLVHEYGLDDLVEITGHVSLDEFNRRIHETDIALNMRDRTVGETSGSLVRLMVAGVCSIVSDVGWYSELPDDSVVKVPIDHNSDKVLEAYLRRLIEDDSLRTRIGENAQRYARAEHAPDHCGEAYLAFIKRVIQERTRRQLIKGVSNEIAQLGITSTDGRLLESVATEVSELIPKAVKLPIDAMPNGNHAQRQSNFESRTPKVNGIDYKEAARQYLGRLSEERRHHLRTKPFYNLANKPAKYRNDGMEEDMHRHFCDFANMAVTLALPAGSRILDVGCGSGWLSEYFARLGYIVKGIDISPDLIQMSRDRTSRVPYGVDPETPLRCTFEVHDIERSPLPDMFDAIICYDSLHHFEDEVSVMKNLAQMLNVGGSLFILEGQRPDANSPGEAELRAVMDEFQTLESPFDNRYLRNLLDECGFAIVGDYVSINGLFEREILEGNRLPLRTTPTNYHYLSCKKVVTSGDASKVPDSRTPGELRAEISLRRQPSSLDLEGGQAFELDLEITNSGDTLWLTATEPRFGIVMPALRVFDETNTLISESHGEPALPRAVAPGETLHLRIAPVVPKVPGRYLLKIDLVAEHVAWFEQQGSKPLLLHFNIVEAR